jgi:RES domain-containing protein
VHSPPPCSHPRFGEFRVTLAAHPEWLAPWSGHVFRFQTVRFPEAQDILSGLGAKLRGGRWNPPGLAALYGSTTDTAALEEAKANDRYYGLDTMAPRLVVAIHADVARMLDLTSPVIRRRLGVTWTELAGEDWRKLVQVGQESLAQALGRAVVSVGASGILARSTAVRRARNVILFPPLGCSGRLAIVDGDTLAHLRRAKQA